MIWLRQTLMAVFGREPQRRCHAPYSTQFENDQIIVRVPDVGDCQAWTQLRSISAPFLVPWEPIWAKDAASASFFMRQWRRFMRRWIQDREYAFFIFRREHNGHEGALLGAVTITDIKRGAYQMGTLGYWMGAPFAGQGIMRQALDMLVPFAFRTLKLQRLEATVLPTNERSIRLLRSLGFREVGLSKNHMQIEGAWRDQIIFEKSKDY